MKDRVRVAAAQYRLRPVDRFEGFEEQVRGIVATAKAYHCDLLVLPEWFTLQLLPTLDDQAAPIDRQARALATYESRLVELFSRAARATGMYIAAGTLPAVDLPDTETLYNECYLFGPDGDHQVQGKLHSTRFEKEELRVTPHRRYRVFDTELGKLAINIGHDVEFPELARAAAREGADIIIVPCRTDDRHGYLRVRLCAQARAIENQVYVVQSPTVGGLPGAAPNYGAAAIFTPSDYTFARDGLLAEGAINDETLVIGDLDMRLLAESRESGTVLSLHQSTATAEVTARVEAVEL